MNNATVTLYRAIDPESGIDLTGLLTFQEMEDYIAGSDAVRHGITWDVVESEKVSTLHADRW